MYLKSYEYKTKKDLQVDQLLRCSFYSCNVYENLVLKLFKAMDFFCLNPYLAT